MYFIMIIDGPKIDVCFHCVFLFLNKHKTHYSYALCIYGSATEVQIAPSFVHT